jgi:hypothetical protein
MDFSELPSTSFCIRTASTKSEDPQKTLSIGIILEDGFSFNTSYDNMMQCTGRIYADFTWHKESCSQLFLYVNI